MTYTDDYIKVVKLIADKVERKTIEKMIDLLVEIRKNKGRLFFLGVGGGAGNATHAVNDFRKICGIESYSPCDNVPKLTARINDDRRERVISE